MLLYEAPYCKCDPGYYAIGLTDCADVKVPGPCNPSPCVEPDKNVCEVVSGSALCVCNSGFFPVDDKCIFSTCPSLSAHTGLIVYDATGASISAGFDPLQSGDAIQVRVEIEVSDGSGDVNLELHPYNLTLEPARLACDATACTGKIKGPLLQVPMHLTPGLHVVEMTAKFGQSLYPLGLSARLVAGPGCEIPQSRSDARIGVLGVQDAKGFDCIDLDRTRAVQVTHDVAEKNTSDYGAANGQAKQYTPVASIVSTVTQCFTRKANNALFLAGDPHGQLPWAVDNDIVIERFDASPQPGDVPVAVLAMGTDTLQSTQGPQVQQGPKPDVPGTHFGIPNGAPFGFSPGHARLDDLVPPGKMVWLRFIALDYGVVGRLTRLHVMSVPMAEAPPRCIDNSQCPGGKSGCVNGTCTGVSCTSGSCPSNQFCVGGLCTTRCDLGGGSCGSGLECHIRACELPSTSGVCSGSQKDQDCPLGQTCNLGKCVPGCHHPRHQDQSYASDPSFCMGQKPALCPHCPAPEDGCWNNVCAQCEVDPDCGSGLWCVNRKCVSPW